MEEGEFQFQPIQRDVNCFAWGRSPIGQLCFLSLLFCGAQILTIPRDKSWLYIDRKATQNLQTDVRKLVFSLIIYIYISYSYIYIQFVGVPSSIFRLLAPAVPWIFRLFHQFHPHFGTGFCHHSHDCLAMFSLRSQFWIWLLQWPYLKPMGFLKIFPSTNPLNHHIIYTHIIDISIHDIYI